MNSNAGGEIRQRNLLLGIQVSYYLLIIEFIKIFFLLRSTSRIVDEEDEKAEELKSEEGDEVVESIRSDSPLTCSGAEARSQRAESEATDDDSEEVLDTREKFLIFTMGSRTYTPHQIG